MDQICDNSHNIDRDSCLQKFDTLNSILSHSKPQNYYFVPLLPLSCPCTAMTKHRHGVFETKLVDKNGIYSESFKTYSFEPMANQQPATC